MENKPKYISLKEAAKMSGLHSDYIGQLIRKGKISGIKIYSSIAWMTTEEAIKEYQNNLNENKLKTLSHKEKIIIYLKSLATIPTLLQVLLYTSITISISFILVLFYIFSTGIEKKLEQKTIKKIEAGLFILIFFILGMPTALLAQTGVPRILNHQGRLFDTVGNLLGETSTEFCFKFSIYNDAVVGTPDLKLWPSGSPSTMTVMVTDGVFNVGIGDIAAGGDALNFNFEQSSNAYLNIEVANKVGVTCTPGDGLEIFDNLNPRQRIVSSAFAINAATVRGFTASESASSTMIPVLTAGNLILGANNPQINATDTNSLILQGGNISGNLLLNVFSGFVGIGTSTPRAKLHLANGSFLQDGPNPILTGGTNLALPGGGIMDIKISGRYAYAIFNNAAGTNILRIIDVTDPQNPQIVGGTSLSLPSSPRSIFVSGHYAYLVFRNASGTNNFRIVDISDPSTPTIVSGASLTLPANGQHIFVSGRYAYLTFDNVAANSTFRIIDIGNPDQPMITGGQTLNLPTAPRQVYVQGRYAYIAFYTATPTDALRIIDINNPANPTMVGGGALTLGSSAWSIAVAGRYAYIGFDNAAGMSIFRIVDIANPSSPVIVGGNNLSLPGFAKALTVSGKYAYLAFDNAAGINEFRILDISNPISPSVAGGESLSLPGFPKAVALAGKYAYVGFFQGAGTDTFRVIDITGLEAVSVTASTIEAGSIQITANAQIQNQLSVGGGMQVTGGSLFSQGDVAIKGNILFAPMVNSTSTFIIQNAAGSEIMFQANTNGNQIKIGDDDLAGGPTTILVLDKKADAGDPTGVNGATYYNSNVNRFRCFENSLWKNCNNGTLSYSLLRDAAGVTLTSPPSAGLEVTNLVTRRMIDLTGMTNIRAQFSHSLNSGAIKLRIDFSLNNCATWSITPLISAFGAGGMANNLQISAFSIIPSTAQTDVCIRAVIIGNGSLSPTVRYIDLDAN